MKPELKTKPVPEVPAILDKVAAAICSFLDRERLLLAVGVNERSLTHKLAEHLQRQFADWDVDCEYNRDLDQPKLLRLPRPGNTRTNDTAGSTIFPDIIVHRRNSPDNVVVIEVKKAGSQSGLSRDIAKLKGLTRRGDRYSYQCGRNLWIDCAGLKIAKADVYVDGRLDRARSGHFRAIFHQLGI